MIYRAEIISFRGSWGSGLAQLRVKDLDTGEVRDVPADNGPLGRALGAAFGAVISGHKIDQGAISDKEIFYVMDDMGLCMGGFVPVCEADDELWDAYETQKQTGGRGD